MRRFLSVPREDGDSDRFKKCKPTKSPKPRSDLPLVHRALEPGLLESAYVQYLCYELNLRRLPLRLELPLPVIYKGLKLDCGYRLDLVVSDTVIGEVKAVERLAPVHEA